MKSTVEFQNAALLAEHAARASSMFWLFLCIAILSTVVSVAWNTRGALTRNVIGTAARIERFGGRASRRADASHQSRAKRIFVRRARRRFVAGMKQERFRVTR